MRFDKRKDPALCASKESTRYNGVAVVAYAGKHFVAATDGRCLSMVEATLEETDSAERGVSQRAAFAAARKAAPEDACKEATVALGAKSDVVAADYGATKTEYQQMDVRFPDVTGVVPKGKVKFTVSLNAALLAQIQKALDADAVTLEFEASDMPMRVTPCYGKDARAIKDASFGVLMPWRS